MCCHITSLESCFFGVSYRSPLALIQKWTNSLESSKKNEACAKRVLDCLLIFWLNCNILTCCPTFFIFSVLYSFPHCNISSLPTLQHPLFQTFMPPPPHCHKTISFLCSPLHPILQYPWASPTTFLPPLFSHWYPWLSPTTFTYVFWSASWACSKLCGCWLAGQLPPVACQSWQTIPCLLLLGQQMAVSGAQWGSCRKAES